MHESFGSVCAQVAEVSLEDGAVKVHRVVAAFDCGLVVNPLTVEAQVQGAIAFGLSAALHGAITLKDGQVQQSNFHNYRVLRMSEMPKVEVHIVPSHGRHAHRRRRARHAAHRPRRRQRALRPHRQAPARAAARQDPMDVTARLKPGVR